MNLSNHRIQSVYQTWDFLAGLGHDANLPKDVRQEMDWLVRHYPYSQKVHLSFPLPLDARGEDALQIDEDDDDQWPDAMPPVWMTVRKRSVG